MPPRRQGACGRSCRVNLAVRGHPLPLQDTDGLALDGIDYEQIRVPVRRRDRDEIADLTGQRWVPVLVHEDEVVHDSRRIVEYLDYLRSRREADAEPAGAP